MRLTFLILFISTFISCSEDDLDHGHRTSYYYNIIDNSPFNDTFKVVTYNIKLGFPAFADPWNKNEIGADSSHIRKLAMHLSKIEPDLIALQEVPRNRTNTIVKDLIEMLAKEMNMNYAYGAHGYNDAYNVDKVMGEWGNAILSEYEIISIENEEVEFIDVWKRRSLLNAKISDENGDIIELVSLHYYPMEEGIPNTVEYLSGISNKMIVAGDFNYTGEVPEFKELGLIEADEEMSLHGIDRIFATDDHFEIIRIGSLADPEKLSDHPANFAVWRFK